MASKTLSKSQSKAPEKAVDTPKTEAASTRKPITTADKMVEAIAYSHIGASEITRAAEKLHQLSGMLYDIYEKDRCDSRAAYTIQGMTFLMSAIAYDLDELGEYFLEFAKDAHTIREQAEGGAQ